MQLDQLKEEINLIISALTAEQWHQFSIFREKPWRNHFPDNYNHIIEFKDKNLNKLTYLKDYKTWANLLWLILNDLEKGKCSTCHKDIIDFKNFNVGYAKHCSHECRQLDPVWKKWKKDGEIKALQAKYGEHVTNISQVPGRKEKIEKTMMDRYGVKYNSQRIIIKKANSERLKTKEHKDEMRAGV